MQKRWTLLDAPENAVTELADALKINKTLCQVLAQRGITTFEAAKDYFRPRLDQLHDPFLMKDMDKAVERLTTAFTKQEKILVFGDYDVDGTTAVATMYQFLQSVYDPALLDFYIPHRYHEGYGISEKGILHAKSNGFSLIISLDCGIKSVDLIRYAKELGISFIVCDHHLPEAELPPADAILNPKQPGCPYPYKDLCGCGVGFKLVSALLQSLRLPPENAFRFLDLVATAIAADIVPMTGENRILAYYGIKKVNEDPCPGIKALIKLSGFTKPFMHITNLVFVIAPRVNAAGRMDDARKAVLLFIEQNYHNALAYAEMLHNDNADRKDADSTITEEALAIIESDAVLVSRKSTVVFQPHWHKGVVGIVASRLIEKYYRPTVVLTSSGELVAGSARSVAGFNLYEAIYACRDHLIGYGGHFAAAGMTMHPSQVALFSLKFESVIAATIEESMLVPQILVDATVSFTELQPAFHRILEQMEPYGPDNLRPVFLARKVYDTGQSRVLKEAHIRFSLRQGNTTVQGIGFSMAEKFSLLQAGQPLDVLFTLEENEWNEVKSLQLKVIDLRTALD